MRAKEFSVNSGRYLQNSVMILQSTWKLSKLIRISRKRTDIAARGIGRAIAVNWQEWVIDSVNYKSNTLAAEEALREIRESGGDAELLKV